MHVAFTSMGCEYTFVMPGKEALYNIARQPQYTAFGYRRLKLSPWHWSVLLTVPESQTLSSQTSKPRIWIREVRTVDDTVWVSGALPQ